MVNGFWFYSILAGWSTWQWAFLNFSQNFWSFDTPIHPWVCILSVCWKWNLKQIEAIPPSVHLKFLENSWQYYQCYNLKNSSPTKAIAIAQFYQLASRYWLQCLPCTHSFSRPDTIYFRELEESSLINGLACIRTLSRLLASASHTSICHNEVKLFWRHISPALVPNKVFLTKIWWNKINTELTC